MIYLKAVDVVEIHNAIIAKIGGSSGLREPGMLVAVTDKPRAALGGEDLYPSLFDKAAALFEGICNYHVFVDGNKRTAIACLEYFLGLNAHELTAAATEKERFILDTAMNNPDLAEIAIWIKKHSKKVSKK